MSTKEDMEARLQALEAERDLLRTIVHSIPIPIYMRNVEGRFIFANQASLQNRGFNQVEDILGKSDFDLFPKDLAERYQANDQALLASKEPILEMVEPSLTPDGKKQWKKTTKVPLYDEDGQPKGLVGLGQDVTEEYLLQEEHKKLNAQIENLYHFSQTANITQNNQDLLTALVEAISPENLLSAGLFYPQFNDLNKPDSLELVANWHVNDQPVYKAGDHFPIADYNFAQTWLNKPNQAQLISNLATASYIDENIRQMFEGVGSQAVVLVSLFYAEQWQGILIITWDKPHLFSQAEAYFYQALPTLIGPIIANRRLIDTLEQVVKEQTIALKDSEAKFRSFVEGTDNLITQVDQNGDLIYVNRAAADRFGLPEDECIGRSAFDFVHPDDRQATQEAFYGWLHDKVTNITYENRNINLTGEVYDLVWTINLHFDNHKKLRYVNSIARDVTHQKQAEREQKSLQQALIQAQQQVIQELSTPIIPIIKGVLVIPLIGAIDSQRAKLITRTLLKGLSQHKAKVVILDITGVPIVDTDVANALNKTIQAAQLKGAKTIISGISDAVAETIVDLGINWHNLDTVGDLQTGLGIALTKLGRK